jgi:hypothetical protein
VAIIQKSATNFRGFIKTRRNLPSVFQDVREYRDRPNLFEQAQAVFHVEALYKEISAYAQRWYRKTHRKARVLDLCAATGLSAIRVNSVIPVEELTLVEHDELILSKARSHLEHIDNVKIEPCDAVHFKGKILYDLILMNSAYHHIEDERKVEFLRNAAENLVLDGQIIIGEHFLPYYEAGDQDSFRKAVVMFYEILISDLKLHEVPDEIVGAFRMAGYYCWKGYYEYKVCMKIFIDNLMRAGLVITALQRVWPENGALLLEKNVGSFAISVGLA